MAEENEARELEDNASTEKKPAQKKTTTRTRSTRTTLAKKTSANAPKSRPKKPTPEEAAESVAESLAELAYAKAHDADTSDVEHTDLGIVLPARKRKNTARATAKKAESKPKSAVEKADTSSTTNEAQGNTRGQKKTAPLVVTFSSGEEVELPARVEPVAPMTTLLFQEPDVTRAVQARRSRRKKADEQQDEVAQDALAPSADEPQTPAPEGARKSRRGSRGGRSSEDINVTPAEEVTSEEQTVEPVKRTRQRKRTASADKAKTEAPNKAGDESLNESSVAVTESGATVRRRRRRSSAEVSDEVTAPHGSTRLEAKRQRRKEGREAGRRRQSISESEFLARRESVNREMLVREQNGLNQIAVIEDGVLVEHYVARHTQSSMVGNVYLGRVQNVLPSMEAAFVDIGKGRNAVLYAGEVNWEAAGMDGMPRRIEDALKSGDTVLVQVTKDPIGHKGARLTAQITLAGRHLVLVPQGAMTGISRKLPEKERMRLKKILKEVVPPEHGVIVRTAAEGASDEQLRNDVERLSKTWEDIQAKAKSTKNAPSLLKGEPELAVRVIRDVFNEDFNALKVEGDNTWNTIYEYVHELSPELEDRLVHWEEKQDIFSVFRVDEQLAKAFDRKVFLPSGGSLVIDRTEAMTVIDVNTGKFTGSGGTLEETVTRNNLEAAEEIVRQLRLRDIGGIIVIDFIDMVLEVNRDLVLRRLIECLGRDRTRHQVAEVTSLGLVQMTRKRVGQGLVEAFSTTCQVCEGRGYITHDNPVEKGDGADSEPEVRKAPHKKAKTEAVPDPKQAEVKAALASIAAAAAHKHEDDGNRPGGAGETERSSDGITSVPASDSSAEKASGGKRKQRETKSKERTRKTQGASRRAGSASAEVNGTGQTSSAQDAPAPASDNAPGVLAAPAATVPPVATSSAQETGATEEKRGNGRRKKPVVTKETSTVSSDKPAARTRRRVTSSGIITPSTSPTSAIMSFPVSKKD
ncbi:ribonuclease E [Arcanobacterium pluranimalium]|uniref:Rne/Rng family ribonuclease n=1 Tax=Arcanobacterium pluranimalium TaxID=108028 RepID=UPI0019582531|nr:Rne/Rng family ribonuclease [Arcanobacterium pluranimalium]MBM7825229.1 ribonuclease E [Arcanobacterium pluranimalium]